MPSCQSASLSSLASRRISIAVVVDDLDLWEDQLRDVANETFNLVSEGDRCIDVIEFQQWLGKGWRDTKEKYAAEIKAKALVEEQRKEARATREAMEELERELEKKRNAAVTKLQARSRGQHARRALDMQKKLRAVTKLQARKRGQNARRKVDMRKQLKVAAAATAVVAAAGADLVSPQQPDIDVRGASRERPPELLPDDPIPFPPASAGGSEIASPREAEPEEVEEDGEGDGEVEDEVGGGPDIGDPST